MLKNVYQGSWIIHVQWLVQWNHKAFNELSIEHAVAKGSLVGFIDM